MKRTSTLYIVFLACVGCLFFAQSRSSFAQGVRLASTPYSRLAGKSGQLWTFPFKVRILRMRIP